MTSYLLDTASLVIFDAYNIKLGFPLISYAENIGQFRPISVTCSRTHLHLADTCSNPAILAQNVIIVTLILSLGTSAARTSSSLPIPTLLAFYILVAASLYSLCYLTPLGLLKSLFTLSIPLSVLSKIPQIISNARSGSTGQLSAFLVFASLAGTAARVYTSMSFTAMVTGLFALKLRMSLVVTASQETGDTLLFFNYALGAALNSILAVQLGIYRSNTLSASQKAKSEPIELRSVAPPPQPAAVPTPTPLQQSQRIPGSTPSKSTSVQPGSRASPVAARSTRTPSKQWVRKAD